MRRTVIGLFVVAVLALAAPAAAQTGLGWQLQVFQPGVSPTTGGHFYALDIPPAAVTCSASIVMPATPTAPPVNPRSLYWTHPDLPGQVCKADLSGQSSFVALPPGGPYGNALVAVNEAGTSPRGIGEVPFRRVDPAGPPGSVRLVK